MQKLKQMLKYLKLKSNFLFGLLLGITITLIFTADSGNESFYNRTTLNYTPEMGVHECKTPPLQRQEWTPDTNVETTKTEPPETTELETYTNEPFSILIDMEIPQGYDSSFKSYMDYRTLTNRNSIQWEMQQEAWTDDLGFRRYKDYYMVALGTFYTPSAGIVIEIEFSGGRVIQAISGDIKSDRHTDPTNRFNIIDSENISMVEFIVDTPAMEDLTRRLGTMCNSGMQGNVVRISIIQTED